MLELGTLIDLLSQLPRSTRVLTAGTEGIHDAELGNLFPIKCVETPFGIAVYIEDGLEDHGSISDKWLPLDEFVAKKASA